MHEHIELGGGPNPNYHPNFDIIDHSGVDVKCDLSKGIPLGDGEVKYIYSIDFIEHLWFEDFLNLLKECKRVLIDEGKIEFITPDCKRTVKVWNDWNEYIMHIFIGAWAGEGPMRHKQWQTPELMRYILEYEGWRDIEITEFQKDSDNWREPKMRVVAKVEK